MNFFRKNILNSLVFLFIIVCSLSYIAAFHNYKISHNESWKILKIYRISSQLPTSRYYIYINEASFYELIQIKGVGPRTASRILAYRADKKILSINDLKNIKGIGEKKSKQIAKQVKFQ